jgi:hypothetical protein
VKGSAFVMNDGDYFDLGYQAAIQVLKATSLYLPPPSKKVNNLRPIEDSVLMIKIYNTTAGCVDLTICAEGLKNTRNKQSLIIGRE